MFSNEQTYVIDEDTTVRIKYDEGTNQMLAIDIKTGDIVCSSRCASNTFIKNDIDPYHDNFYEVDSFIQYETAGILHEIEQCRQEAEQFEAEELEEECDIDEPDTEEGIEAKAEYDEQNGYGQGFGYENKWHLPED